MQLCLFLRSLSFPNTIQPTYLLPGAPFVLSADGWLCSTRQLYYFAYRLIDYLEY